MVLPMPTCHAHNLRQPLPGQRPWGIRVRVRGSDPFTKLVGAEWTREHWYASQAERETALAEMSGRYVYFRPGDAPALDYERIDPVAA
jgi:hypothetical protein